MRLRTVVACALPAAALSAVLAWPRPESAGAGIPTVRVGFAEQDPEALFASGGEEERTRLRVHFTDVDGATVAAKASRRGFSPWHHGRVKPSLRIEQTPARDELRPRWIELSRPEDPLAIANWLPDRLCDGLGLLHAATAPVHLLLDGDDFGVYLRSLRPGDDLAAAAGRARGTFCKGDAIGERRRLDLWADAAAWRTSGAESPRAQALLRELLERLREPASAENLERLAAVFDVAAAARAHAVAVLVGSIHADRAHNHVLFADPTKDCLEPLLWDANAFGIHAEPTLPVEVARHPLAERLLCDPRFVHARNEVLWHLLGHDGSAAELAEAVRTHLAAMAKALADDPQIARLRLQRGEFVVEAVPLQDLPQELARLRTFVTVREQLLREHFAAARVHVAPLAGDASGSVVTVFGSVGVRVARADGTGVQAMDGRPADLLLPGLSQELHAAPQHRLADGRGVAAPHARPAPLVYTLRAPGAELVFRNAHTGDVVPPSREAPPAVATRSVHPWSMVPPPAELPLGPGPVRLDASVDLGPATTLRIAAGTQLRLGRGVSIRTRGPVMAAGTATAPITIDAEPGEGAALACIGGPVQLAHVTLRGARPVLLGLHGCGTAHVAHCTLRGGAGDGIVVAGGTTHLLATDVALCRGHALVAHAGATVHAEAGRFAFADHGVVARDEATVHLRGCELAGNMVAGLAGGGCGPFGGGTIVLDGVRCRDSGQKDVVASGDGVVLLREAAAGPGGAGPPR